MSASATGLKSKVNIRKTCCKDTCKHKLLALKLKEAPLVNSRPLSAVPEHSSNNPRRRLVPSRAALSSRKDCSEEPSRLALASLVILSLRPWAWARRPQDCSVKLPNSLQPSLPRSLVAPLVAEPRRAYLALRLSNNSLNPQDSSGTHLPARLQESSEALSLSRLQVRLQAYSVVKPSSLQDRRRSLEEPSRHKPLARPCSAAVHSSRLSQRNNRAVCLVALELLPLFRNPRHCLEAPLQLLPVAVLLNRVAYSAERLNQALVAQVALYSVALNSSNSNPLSNRVCLEEPVLRLRQSPLDRSLVVLPPRPASHSHRCSVVPSQQDQRARRRYLAFLNLLLSRRAACSARRVSRQAVASSVNLRRLPQLRRKAVPSSSQHLRVEPWRLMRSSS